MRTTQYPELTIQERKRLYNKQFRERKKSDPAYQDQLTEYRRRQNKKEYDRMKECNPTKYREYNKKRAKFATESRKRSIERGEIEKYTTRNHNYYTKNREKCLRQTANRRKQLRTTTSENYLRYLIESAKPRAKKKNIEFSITIADLVMPSICPVLGIPIITTNDKQSDNSPSIDRINSELGYIPGNVHIISWRANTLKKDATPQELQLLADFFNANSVNSLT